MRLEMTRSLFHLSSFVSSTSTHCLHVRALPIMQALSFSASMTAAPLARPRSPASASRAARPALLPPAPRRAPRTAAARAPLAVRAAAKSYICIDCGWLYVPDKQKGVAFESLKTFK